MARRARFDATGTLHQVIITFKISSWEHSSLRSQLEYWNDGIMGYGKLGLWIYLGNLLDKEVNK